MGLTIHYQLKTRGQEAHARKLVQQLRQAALDLSFAEVGEIIEFRGEECDFNKCVDNDPYRWLLIQAQEDLALPVEPREKRRGIGRSRSISPLHIIAFSTYPGDGCEQANFGLCSFPREIVDSEFGRLDTKLRGWSWHSFCKTHYASDPRCGGLPHFLKCHLSLVALLDAAKRLRCLSEVHDEGTFWETRSLERLTKEIGQQSAMLAGFLGQLQDAFGEATGGAATIEAPIRDFPNFEHLEAQGQPLLPAHLPELLKALTRNRPARAVVTSTTGPGSSNP